MTTTATAKVTRFGCVGVLGRANAGKSSLVNALVGEKVGIVSPRPQTTRKRILGVLTTDENQVVFCDTPGLHAVRHALDAFMLDEIHEAVGGMVVALYLVDPADADPEADAAHLAELKGLTPAAAGPQAPDGERKKKSATRAPLNCPIVLVFTKTDAMAPKPAGGRGRGGRWRPTHQAVAQARTTRDAADKTMTNGVDGIVGTAGLATDLCERLALLRDQYATVHPFAGVMAVSAKKGQGLEAVLTALVAHLPEGPHAYDADLYTLEPERDIVGEAVREQVLLRYFHEIPHSVAVQIEEFKEREGGKTYVRAVLHVERESHKKILLGERGASIKALGTASRLELNRLLGRDIFLELWVKVTPQWRRREHLIQRLGYRHG